MFRTKARHHHEGEKPSPSFSKSRIPKNPFFFAALAQGLLILVLLITSAILPPHTFIIRADEFDIAEHGNVYCENDQLTILPALDGTPAAVQLAAYGCTLYSGAYDISVNYRLDTEEEKNFFHHSATFFLDSNRGLTTDSIKLSDDRTQAHGRAWAPFALKGTDVTACLSYQGSSALILSDIQVKENVAYRFVCIAGLALAFALIDVLYALFFSSRKAPAWAAAAVVLSGIVFAACLPHFASFVYNGHDIAFHLKRIVSLAEELKYGQLPVRMHTTVGNDFGYPLSLYYGDLFLYLPAVLYNCAVPLQTCYQIYTLLIHLLTCAIAYFSLIRATKHQALSLLGAALYTLSVYRLSNVYVRAAVGEYTALTFMPLVVLGMYQIYTKKRLTLADWLPLALGMTGVVLSHVLSTEMLAFDLVLLCVCLFRQTLDRNRILSIGKAACVCLVLSAWFWVPFADCFLKQSVNIQTAQMGIQDKGTYLVQLLGVFTNGAGEANSFGMRHEAPQAIGAPLVLGMVIMLYCMWKRHSWNLTEQTLFKWVRVLFAVALVNLIMTLESFPWDAIQRGLGRLGSVVSSLQFPWRWIAVAVPLLVFGVVFAMQLIERADRKLYASLFAALLACIVLGTGSFYLDFINNVEEYRSYFKSPYEASDALYHLMGTDPGVIGSSVCSVTEGMAEIESYQKERGVATLQVQNASQEEARITIPVFAYRGYRALDGEGNELAILSGKNNCISVTVPGRYSGMITIRFDSPLAWRIAEAVSACALVFLAVAGVFALAKKGQ